MRLSDHVHVDRRFQRAIRIDVDSGNPESLRGFICPRSAQQMLQSFAQHVRESGQGAFTWTGPYGCGKSSLAVIIAGLLDQDRQVREQAAAALGKRTANHVWKALPVSEKGWCVLPVVGQRGYPEQVIGEMLEYAGHVPSSRSKRWSEKRTLDALSAISQSTQENDGLLLIVDEMGKSLESAASEGADIYLFQQIAELASRSNGRLIFIGILHQSFGEYAHRLSREMRDEWAKIQGRFADLPLSISGSEQIDLISRTIKGSSRLRPKAISNLAHKVAGQTQKNFGTKFARVLENCWPLHPLTACLLGPMSRRRFGQSQRSIFGFLNSAEPNGFQDFLKEAGKGVLYEPHNLWDYLRVNLEPSILASSDGHRWAVSIDAMERCIGKGGDGLHLRLLKTIAILDLLKESSGLHASGAVLGLALRDCQIAQINAALRKLQTWSLVVYRKFTESYAIFEGSDFDIDRAVARVSKRVGEIDFSEVTALSQLPPVVAKRHYHETGAMRWFDTVIVALSKLEAIVDTHEPCNGAVGTFFLAIPTENEGSKASTSRCSKVAAKNAKNKNRIIVVGLSPSAHNISVWAKELWALERVRDEMPELLGDRVARAEIYARIESTSAQLEGELERMFNSVRWHAGASLRPKLLTKHALNGLASDLADEMFSRAPRIHNELLGRAKPSSSAIAGLNNLLRRMVSNEGEVRLGISGFPTEAGLFSSLLEDTRLYRKSRGGRWRFKVPESRSDPRQLRYAWREAKGLLKGRSDGAVPAADIYALWRKPPFGIKEGLLPVLFVAFYLSNRESLAFYRQGIFQATVSDLDMDYLNIDATDIQLRWMDLPQRSRQLLSSLADIVRDLDKDNELVELEPIDVARGLIAIHDQLPAWVGRTQLLSKDAKQVRQIFKNAKDPNKLIFDDLSTAFGMRPEVVEECVRQGLVELCQAYPAMLNQLKEILRSELQVPNASPAMLAELRDRAKNIREVGGDHRLEAFVMRIANFKDLDEEIEALASMAVGKPSQNWTDADISRAKLELANMAQQFLRLEAFARVNGRSDKRHALALIAGIAGEPRLLHGEFCVTDVDREQVNALIKRMNQVFKSEDEIERNIILAALTELSAQYLDSKSTED